MSVRSFTGHSTPCRAGALAVMSIALLVPTGCTRTSDGTVVMAPPPGYSWMRDRLSNPSFSGFRQREPAPDIASYPPPPPAEAQPAPPRREAARTRRVEPAADPPDARRPSRPPSVMRIGVRAPFEQSEAGQPLNCRNEQTESGRIKVVCD